MFSLCLVEEKRLDTHQGKLIIVQRYSIYRWIINTNLLLLETSRCRARSDLFPTRTTGFVMLPSTFDKMYFAV